MTTAYQRKSPTSRAAAVRAAGKAQSVRERIVQFVWEQGAKGATRDEIAHGLGILIQTVCARVADELAVTDGAGNPREPRFRVTGDVRRTRAGSAAFVIVTTVTPYVEEQLALVPLQRHGSML